MGTAESVRCSIESISEWPRDSSNQLLDVLSLQVSFPRPITPQHFRYLDSVSRFTLYRTSPFSLPRTSGLPWPPPTPQPQPQVLPCARNQPFFQCVDGLLAGLKCPIRQRLVIMQLLDDRHAELVFLGSQLDHVGGSHQLTDKMLRLLEPPPRTDSLALDVDPV